MEIMIKLTDASDFVKFGSILSMLCSTADGDKSETKNVLTKTVTTVDVDYAPPTAIPTRTRAKAVSKNSATTAPGAEQSAPNISENITPEQIRALISDKLASAETEERKVILKKGVRIILDAIGAEAVSKIPEGQRAEFIVEFNKL